MGQTHRNRRRDVLNKHYPLSLDDEEVDQLVDVANNNVQRLPGNRVVLARAELRGQSRVDGHLTGHLCGDGDAKHHPGELETPSENIQVARREDDGDDECISNSRSSCKGASACRVRLRRLTETTSHTGVIPREQLREEGVIVGQRLARGGRVGRGLPSGGQVVELAASLGRLVLYVLGNRACGQSEPSSQQVALIVRVTQNIARQQSYVPFATELKAAWASGKGICQYLGGGRGRISAVGEL